MLIENDISTIWFAKTGSGQTQRTTQDKRVLHAVADMEVDPEAAAAAAAIVADGGDITAAGVAAATTGCGGPDEGRFATLK